MSSIDVPSGLAEAKVRDLDQEDWDRLLALGAKLQEREAADLESDREAQAWLRSASRDPTPVPRPAKSPIAPKDTLTGNPKQDIVRPGTKQERPSVAQVQARDQQVARQDPGFQHGSGAGTGPQGPLPPRDPEEGPGFAEFVPHPARFSPALLEHRPTNKTEAEAWLRQATEELKGYYDSVDSAYLDHMAKQGRLDDYMQENLQSIAETDGATRLQFAAQMMPFAVGSRTPQLNSMIGMELQVAAGKPELTEQYTPIKRDWDTANLMEGEIAAGRKLMGEGVTSVMNQEGQRGFIKKYLMGPVISAARETFFQGEVGQPERIAHTMVQQADKAAAGLKKKLLGVGWNETEATERAEEIRQILLHEGQAAAEMALKKAGLDEGAVEWFLNKTAAFIGFIPALKVGPTALGAVRMVDRLLKSPVSRALDFASKGIATAGRAKALTFLASPVGVLGWAQLMGPGQPAIDRIKATLPEGPEREAALESAAAVNGATTVMMLPILHYSRGLGQLMTMGATSKITSPLLRHTIESAIGFAPTSEAGAGALRLLREGVMKADVEMVNKTLRSTFAAFPDAPGLLEGMAGAMARAYATDDPNTQKAAWEDFRHQAREYAANFFPTLAGFGATVATGLLVPPAVNRRMLNESRKNIRESFTGEERKQAEAILNEIAEKATPETAEEKVAAKGEKAQAAAKLAEELEPVRSSFESAAHDAYQDVSVGPAEIVRRFVEQSGGDLTDPKQAYAMFAALSGEVHKQSPAEPGRAMSPEAMQDVQALGDAFQAAREAAVARKSATPPPKAAEEAKPASEEAKPKQEAEVKPKEPEAEAEAKPKVEEPAREVEPTPEQLERTERAGAIRDELRAARDMEARARRTEQEGSDAQSLHDLAEAHRIRAKALRAGEDPPSSREALKRAQEGRAAARLRRAVEAPMEREQAAVRALDDQEGLAAVATAHEGRKLVDRAMAVAERQAREADDPDQPRGRASHTKATAKAARDAVARHFVEHVQDGDLLEGINGPYVVVGKPTATKSGGMHMRVRLPDGSEVTVGAKQAVAAGMRPTGTRSTKPAPKAEPEPAPKNPVEAATKKRARKRKQRDEKIQEESDKTKAAETPEEVEASQAEVQRLLSERREDESASVLREKLQDGPESERPPQATPDATERSRGPTDANNHPVEQLHEEHKAQLSRVQKVVRMMSAIFRGGELRPETPLEERFARFWSDNSKRYLKESGNREEAAAEAARDFLRQEQGLPPKAEPLVSVIDRIERELKAILEMEGPEAVEALLRLQQEHVTFISGPDAVLLRWSPKGLRMLNRMEAAMVKLTFNASESGFFMVPGVPQWSRLYQSLRAVWPSLHPSYWRGAGAFASFGGTLLDELTLMFRKDPSVASQTWFGRMWDKTLGLPERWGGRLISETSKELNLMHSKVASLLHRTVGPQAEWRKFVMAEPDRDAKMFRALDRGPQSKEWAALTPEEVKVASEIRDVLRQIWRSLAPVTPKGLGLRRDLAVTERAIERFGAELEADQKVREARAMEAMESGEDVDFSKISTPRDQAKALAGLHKRAERLRILIAKHTESGGILEFMHHVAEERDTTLASFIATAHDSVGAPKSVTVGAMKRRTEKLRQSGQLKESVMASLGDYFPQAVAYYHRNALLGRWADRLYGVERPLEFTDLVTNKETGDPSVARNRPIYWNGRTWRFTGIVLRDPKTGETYPVRVRNEKGEWVANPDVPKGAQKVVQLQDWKDRTNTWSTPGTAPPKPSAAQRRVQRANKRMFTQLAEKYGVLHKAATKLGNGKFEDGIEILWDAYGKGPESPEFLALPPKVRDAFLQHVNYLPPHRGELAYAPLRTITASATIRDKGLFDEAVATNPQRIIDIKEVLDKFAARAGSSRLHFTRVDGTIALLGRIANGLKIGWWNVKTAANVLAGGTFYNAALPIHPAIMARSSVLVYEGLMRWHAANRRATSLKASDIKPGHEQSPFQAGADAMRTPKAELDAMTPEARASRIIEDDALVAMFENPVFMGKQADMVRLLMTEGAVERNAARMMKWRVGETVERGGKRYVVHGAPKREGKYVTVRAAEVDASGKAKGRIKTLTERAEPYGTIMGLLRGERGYEFIGAMEHFIRAQSFLAGYRTARKSGKSDKEARLVGENITIYAHGVFNQMTASAFFQSPLGPFLGGIKSYAARQLGIWLRSPHWIRARYQMMATAFNSMLYALGGPDMSNQFGTSASNLPFVGPWWDAAVSIADEEADEDGKWRWVVENMLKPGTIGVHIPSGESPGMHLATGLWATAQEVASGDMHGAMTRLGRSVWSAYEPWFWRSGRQAFDTEEREPGRYLYTPTFGESPSYSLNQTGAAQLVQSLVFPGTQREVADQMTDRSIAEARVNRSKGASSSWRESLKDRVRQWDQITASGAMTPEIAKGLNTEVQELVAEGIDLGERLETPQAQASLLKSLRDDLRADALAPRQRSILRMPKKSGRIIEFARALKRGTLTWREADEVATILGGQTGFQDWLVKDKALPLHVKQEFSQAYQEFAAKNSPQATR